MTYNPKEARDVRGRWSSGGESSGSKNPHEMTGHNGHSQTMGLAGAALRGARESASSSAKFGAAYGAVVGGVFGGPVGAVAGALQGGLGGLVGGGVIGAVAGASIQHDKNIKQLKKDATARGVKYSTFWDTKVGAATKSAILGGGIVAGVAASYGANRVLNAGAQRAASAVNRAGYKFYAKSSAARESAKFEARVRAKTASNPVDRKISALRAKAADHSVTPAEREAFAAKAVELTKKHRRG